MATGLLVTGTWGHYSMGALLWGWIGVPAAGAALAARLWPAARELWRRYSRVRQESRAPEAIPWRCRGLGFRARRAQGSSPGPDATLCRRI